MLRGNLVIGPAGSRPARVVGAAASVVLVMSLVGAAQTVPTPVAAPVAAAPGPAVRGAAGRPVVSERPDRVSAAAAARLQGSPVEVVASRSEYQTEYANPDGSFRLEQATSPVRAQARDGSWLSIDPTLVRDGAGLRPKAAAADVLFSATGAAGSPVAAAGHGPRSIGLGWGQALGPPAVAGATASYPPANAWSTYTGAETCTVDTTSTNGAGYYWGWARRRRPLWSPTPPARARLRTSRSPPARAGTRCMCGLGTGPATCPRSRR